MASRKLAKVLSTRDGEIMPSRLRWLYNTVEHTPAATDKNTFGVVGFVKEYPDQADLTSFMTKFDSEAEATTFTVVPVNGDEDDPSIPGTEEASIDVQYASAMAYPTPIIFYSVGGGGEWSDTTSEPLPGDSYNEWLKYLLDLPKIPQTISISYGYAEQAFPLEYAKAVCRLFAQLGARGVSVLYPSGVDGVGPGTCKDGSGNVRFIPEFPSSCTFGVLPSLPTTAQTKYKPLTKPPFPPGPFVTSVGGTMGGTTGQTGHDPEVVASMSGGGFSDHFSRLPYQVSAVSQYLQYLQELGDKYTGLYKYARCSCLFLPFFICTTLRVVPTPTSPRNLSIS